MLPLPEQPLSGTSVLVADDSDVNRVLLTKILERAGARVFAVADGLAAVELVRARGDELDVVLLDLQMPKLDGEQAARLIRGELGRTRLPILALSAGVFDSDRERALAAAMDDFVAKPFERTALLARVRALAARFRALPSANAPSAAGGTADEWPEIDGIDAGDARARLGGDRDLFLSLLERLARELEELGAAESGEPARTAERLHRLRGMAGNLGAHGLARTAAELERRARAGAEVELCELRMEAAELGRSIRATLRTAEPAAPREAPATPREAPATPSEREWRRFVVALDEQELDALESFPRFSAWLRARLGDALHDELHSALDGLDFARARALVRDTAELVRASLAAPRGSLAVAPVPGAVAQSADDR